MKAVSNKILFDIYLALLFLAGCIGFFICIMMIYGFISHNWEILHLFLRKCGIFSLVIILFTAYIDSCMKPDYFEIIFSPKIIRINYYKLNRRNGLYALSFFSYRKNIKSTEISIDNFEFYALSNNMIMMKKILCLYGNSRNNLVKFCLNISLIAKSNYRELINRLEKFGLTPKLVGLSKN